MTATPSTLRWLGQGLLQLLAPKSCWGCACLLPPDGGAFCAACHTAVLRDPHRSCPRCGSSIGPHTDASTGCPRCRREPFRFDGVLRLNRYDGVLRELILRMKYYPGELLAEVLGLLWASHAHAAFSALQADVVIPMPLHWWRRLLRGYNQSATLARMLAQELRLPYRPRWLRRIRNTPHQSWQKSATAKAANVHGAFAVARYADVRGKRVLLIDDVLTTGSTAHEAARPLKQAGAAKVFVAVLARAEPG